MPRKKKATQQQQAEEVNIGGDEDSDGLLALVAAFPPSGRNSQQAKPQPKLKPQPRAQPATTQPTTKATGRKVVVEPKGDEDGWLVVAKQQKQPSKEREEREASRVCKYPPIRVCGCSLPSLKDYSLRCIARRFGEVKSYLVATPLPPLLMGDLITHMKRENALTNQALSSLAQQQTHLDLSHASHIASPTFLAIFKQCPDLSSLNLSHCYEVTDNVLAELVKLCPKVTDLRLSYCLKVTETGIQYLAALTELHTLHLGCDERVDANRYERYYIWEVERGDCTISYSPCVRLTDKGLEALTGLTKLHTFNLALLNEVTLAGLQHFLQNSKSASTLLKLDLSGLQYVPHSIREDPGEANVIIKTIADNCPSLTWLSIASNRSITTTAFNALDSSSKLHELRVLNLANCFKNQWNDEVEEVHKVEGRLPHITHIDHMSGQASSLMKNLPTTFDNITSVTTNSELPCDIGGLPITHFSGYSTVLLTLMNLAAISKLGLSKSDDLTSSDWETIFKGCVELEHLDIFDQLPPEKWSFFTNSATNNQHHKLKVLRFKGIRTSIDPQMAAIVGAAFPNLEKANFQQRCLSETILLPQFACKLVAGCPLLKSLSFAWIVTPTTWTVLDKGLPLLTSLKLQCNTEHVNRTVTALLSGNCVRQLEQLEISLSRKIPPGHLNDPSLLCTKSTFNGLGKAKLGSFPALKNLTLCGFVPGMSQDVARCFTNCFPHLSMLTLSGSYGDYRAEIKELEQLALIFVERCPYLRTLQLSDIWDPFFCYHAQSATHRAAKVQGRQYLTERKKFKQTLESYQVVFMYDIDHYESYREAGGFSMVNDANVDQIEW